MNLSLAGPILIPLLTAAAGLCLFRNPRAERVIAVIGSSGTLVAAGVLFWIVHREGVVVVQVGGWRAPFGITLAADLFSALLVLVTAIVGLAVVVATLPCLTDDLSGTNVLPLLQVLIAGVCGTFLTGDLFNLYVWFEVMLVASFALLAIGGHRNQIRAALKYVALNLVASAFFLTGIGLLYGLSGTLNMADLATRLPDQQRPGLTTSIAMLFLVAFGIKAAAFPWFFWLPASYHTPPIAVTAAFAALLTKAGIYSLVRVFTLIFTHDREYTHTILLVLAGSTMITGLLGAVTQQDLRRLLSFVLVGHSGYLLMGLGLFSVLGVAGTLFYMVHEMIAIPSLFLVSGAVWRNAGSWDLARLGRHPTLGVWLAPAFLLPALSVSGVPPLSGFPAKLALLQAGVSSEQWLIVALAVTTVLLTLAAMSWAYMQVFWKPRPSPHQPHSPIPNQPADVWPLAGLTLLMLILSASAGPVMQLCVRAAGQLLEPHEYLRAILGPSR
jgi:multicomponent Na+:H+ antiporter subunit D